MRGSESYTPQTTCYIDVKTKFIFIRLYGIKIHVSHETPKMKKNA